LGLLQAAHRTYENHVHLVGVKEEGREPLAPVSHAIVNAQIELTISMEGVFQSAREIPKEDTKTIIPVTVASANRTGENIKAHPLSDQLRYLAAFGGEKFETYLEQLRTWAQSEHTHPKVQAVLEYAAGGTIVRDLAACGILEANGDTPANGKLGTTEYGKALVRWRVIPQPSGVKETCWEDATLFSSYVSYFAEKNQSAERDICLITGEEDILCEMHPKGVLSNPNGAKLISANDSSNFTYRGRFSTPRQSVNVGYTTSQKAHNALRWLVANEGVLMGGRSFICWNPEGRIVPGLPFSSFSQNRPAEFEGYQRELSKTISGYENALKENDDVVVAVLDAATTGRLAVTYYNELKASDFMERIEHWYQSCCWKRGQFGVQSPVIWQIVSCAFGTLQGERFKADDRVVREQSQRLLHCIVDRQGVPLDIVRALTVKAGNLQILGGNTRELILSLACALIRKYENDKQKEEAFTLALDLENRDRSYLFGRLLAVLEHAERSTYTKGESRETNAIRMQSVFTQRPMYAWKILEDKLQPYLQRMNPHLRSYFKDMIGEITKQLPDEPTILNKPLEPTYLMGYYLQRDAMFQKKEKNETTDMEEMNDESAES
jgi:CRISPR-associated protein Cas8c/Csd1, subtype I-C/DVULG